MDKIQVAKPYIPEEDIEEIVSRIRTILSSGMLMQGKYVEQFESDYARYVGVRFGVAVNSGTSALHAVLDYFHLDGGEVLVPVNTFLASANAVLFAGGKPVFVEMDPKSLCLDFEDLKRRVTSRTRGVILVHLAGLIQPKIEEIIAFCREKNLFVLEDASHAHGAVHDKRIAGSFGDAAAFSFLATKVMTTGGEGGVVTTNNEDIAKRVKSLRFHGEDYKRGIQDRIGYSWRMTELQAIMGLVQTERLSEIAEKRFSIGCIYNKAFSSIPHVETVSVTEGDIHPYYKYPLILKEPLKRTEVKKKLEEEYAIKSGTSYWPPCHLQPAYRKKFGYKEGDYPIAEKVLEQTISLPIYCNITQEEIERVVEGVKAVCE